MFKTVLFPIDQSREAYETLSKAIELAKSHQSHIILLSVIQPERAEMNNAELISNLVNGVRKKIEQAGITFDVVERKGNPAFVICDVADELNVDVIVLGTRSINIEGDSQSTANRVIQLAPCPVLVVP